MNFAPVSVQILQSVWTFCQYSLVPLYHGNFAITAPTSTYDANHDILGGAAVLGPPHPPLVQLLRAMPIPLLASS